MPGGSQHFLAMDGLRGIAAAAVAIGHLHHTLHSSFRLPNTGLAVDFFFMLSGFVLAYAYADRIETGGFRAFLLARVIRLYPMILAGVAIAFAYFLATAGFSLQLWQYVLSGTLLFPTFMPNGIDPGFLPLDPPAWSLFFEMIASVLFGLGIWRGGPKSLTLLVGASAIALAITVNAYGTFDTGWSADSLGAGLVRVCFGFGAGVLLYRFHPTGKVPRLPLSFPVQATVLALVLLAPPISWLLQLAGALVIFPILILAAAQEPVRRPRICQFLGDVSYPLYIVHWPIYLWFGLIIGPKPWTIPLAFGGAVLAAYVLLKTYDEPVRKLITEFVRSTRRQKYSTRTA